MPSSQALVKKLEELHISPSVLETTAHERLVAGGMLMSLLIGPGSHISGKDTAKNIYGALQYLVRTAISGSLLESVGSRKSTPAFNAFYFDRRLFFYPRIQS
jgi:hypothetical protein